MADKIFIKQAGEPYVSVTVRINWLADGTIKPLKYWTPDGSCYEIVRIYEMTPLAFLRDRGEGLRFRVQAVIKEGPESFTDCHHFAQHEIYLYLADNFFCGKNIIDERYGHKGKEFVPVNLDVFSDCGYEIVSFEAQGTQYVVDRTVAIEPRGSFHAGGIGIWHKVEARQASLDGEGLYPLSAPRMAALYFEINKWFVCVKSV